ncbi:unnamed protein product [Cunninghamella blakesleeana]
MLGALSDYDLASIILEAAVVSYGLEIFIRNIVLLRDDKTFVIHLGKCLLGFFFAVKTSFFLSFYINQGARCFITGRFADIFYHLGMSSGDVVLLSRVHSVVPLTWKTYSIYSSIMIVALRTIVGIIDTVLIELDYDQYGMCIYIDNYYVGPIYTFIDVVLDLYVSGIITYILMTHIKRLESAHVPVNMSLYVGVILTNVFRTVALTVVNITSAIFLLKNISSESIMLVWPIINLFVVLLIGYDSDVTKTIIRLQEQYLRKINKVSSTDSMPIGDSNYHVKSSLSSNLHQHHQHQQSDLPLGQIRTASYHSSQHQHQFI